MFANGILLAAAAQELPDITPGVIATVLLVMAALACSVAMGAYWLIRRADNRPMMPSAPRQPLFAPAPAMVLAIMMMGAFAMLNIFAGGSVASEESVAGAETETETETETAETKEGITEAGEKEEPSGENTDDTATDDTATDDDTADDGELSPKELANLHRMTRLGLWLNLGFNVIELILFGSIIYLAAQGVSRALPRVAPTGPAQQLQPESMGVQAGGEFAPEVNDPYRRPVGGAFSLPDSGSSLSAEWSWPAEVLYALQAFLIAYLPTVMLRGFLVFIIKDAESHPFLKMLEQGPPVDILAMIFFTAVIAAPVVEELVFRVVIMGGLLKVAPPWVAVVVSSVLFGLAHGFPDSIALLPLAFVLAYTYYQRRSYRTVILVHMFFNGFNMLLAGCGLLST